MVHILSIILVVAGLVIQVLSATPVFSSYKIEGEGFVVLANLIVLAMGADYPIVNIFCALVVSGLIVQKYFWYERSGLLHAHEMKYIRKSNRSDAFAIQFDVSIRVSGRYAKIVDFGSINREDQDKYLVSPDSSYEEFPTWYYRNPESFRDISLIYQFLIRLLNHQNKKGTSP